MSELSIHELEAEWATPLPQRDVMALLNIGIVVPVNVATALNVLTEDSLAAAGAFQGNLLGQG